MTKRTAKQPPPALALVEAAAPSRPARPPNITIRLGDAKAYLERLNALPALPVKAEYAVMRIAGELEAEALRYDRLETDIYKDLGELKVDADGVERHSVPDDKHAELAKRVLELRKMEIELPYHAVPAAHVAGCREPLVLRGLHLFFSTDEAEDQ